MEGYLCRSTSAQSQVTLSHLFVIILQWQLIYKIRGLTDSKMSVDWGIPGGSSQVLAIAVWNVLACLGVSEALGKTEVDYVDVVLLFADTNQEVIGFDISVKEVARVDKLNSLEL